MYTFSFKLGKQRTFFQSFASTYPRKKCQHHPNNTKIFLFKQTNFYFFRENPQHFLQIFSPTPQKDKKFSNRNNAYSGGNPHFGKLSVWH